MPTYKWDKPVDFTALYPDPCTCTWPERQMDAKGNPFYARKSTPGCPVHGKEDVPFTDEECPGQLREGK